jgi:hypothetical protein
MIQESLIAETSIDRRAAIADALRREGLLLAWQQSDEANLGNELERAFFLIDRVYPEMPAQHREQFRRQFEELWKAGVWQGFKRPEPLDAESDSG